MASDINMDTKQMELIDFLHVEIDIHQQLLNIYGDQRATVNTSGRWYVSSVTKLYGIEWERESERATGYFYARVHKNGGRVSNSNASCDIHLMLTPVKRYIIKNLHGILKPWSNESNIKKELG